MKKIIFLLLLASNVSFAQMSHESSSMKHEPTDHQMMVDNRTSWGPNSSVFRGKVRSPWLAVGYCKYQKKVPMVMSAEFMMKRICMIHS